MSEPSFVAATLAWCNERRKEKRMEPLDKLPKGKMEDPNSCPCGKATGLAVGTSYYSEPVKYAPLYALPADVRKFVAAFDDLELPQYVE